MEFGDLLRVVGDEPVFETGLLLAGDVDPREVPRQLSRWTRAGRLYQLRRGPLRPGAALPEGQAAPLCRRQPDGARLLRQLRVRPGALSASSPRRCP